MTWFERRKGQKINLTLSAFMYEFKEGAGSKKILAGSNFCLEKKFDPAQKNSILLKKLIRLEKNSRRLEFFSSWNPVLDNGCIFR